MEREKQVQIWGWHNGLHKDYIPNKKELLESNSTIRPRKPPKDSQYSTLLICIFLYKLNADDSALGFLGKLGVVEF